MYIDTHCHLYNEYYEDLETIINNTKPNIIIINGVNYETNKEILKLCKKHTNVFVALGHHPSELSANIEKSINFIKKNINNKKVVAIGEIGLDYYRDKLNKDKQEKLFIKLLEIANEFKKPIIVHSRDAFLETYNILKEYKNLKKVIHCFSYNLDAAYKFIEINAKIGIGGIITFKNNKLKEVVKKIDLKDIVLETDSPYLTPVPYRGLRNDPTKIPFIAKEISIIKGIPLEKVYKTTTKAASTQFDIILESC